MIKKMIFGLMISLSPCLYAMEKLQKATQEFSQAVEEQKTYGRTITLSDSLQDLADVLGKEKEEFLEMGIVYPNCTMQMMLEQKNPEVFEQASLDHQILSCVFHDRKNIEYAVTYFETSQVDETESTKQIRESVLKRVQTEHNNEERKMKSHGRFLLGSLFSFFLSGCSTLWGVKIFVLQRG